MKLLLIGDERKIRRLVAWGFSTDAWRVQLASSRAKLEELLGAEPFQAACLDWKMQDGDAGELAEVVHAKSPDLPIIALVGEKDREPMQDSKAYGVVAQLTAPFPIEELHAMIQRHAAADVVVAPTTDKAPSPEPPDASSLFVTAKDEPARRALELAVRSAKSNAAILILGETGTGKSQLALTIHHHSAIHQRPFVTVNCPCLSHELLESDLFGHVRGSFTGAVQDTWGKVAAADGGTLFLDEVGDLPMSLQPKLLRLLQEKQYERVGETISRTANVRIIAATNRDLKAEVAAGRFREDLFYRLNVIAIDVPALRGRPTQILAAAEGFLASISQELGKPAPRLSVAARKVLESYSWPGNLRELRNAVERAAILSNGTTLEPDDFPALLAQAPKVRYQIGGPISLHALETAHIQMVLANSSSLEEAARILEIDKSTLYRKRKQMEARVEPFATSPEGATREAVASTG